ncbi:histidine kinase [Novosphingobium sp. PC22D]|nr:histidine kinase [Novosphingobium sp. PC22D]
MDASRFIPTPVFREKRRAQLARVALRDARGEPMEVLVRDVSKRGLSATANGPAPEAGDPVAIHLPDGRELWGLVRWVEGRSFGVEFDTSG